MNPTVADEIKKIFDSEKVYMKMTFLQIISDIGNRIDTIEKSIEPIEKSTESLEISQNKIDNCLSISPPRTSQSLT